MIELTQRGRVAILTVRHGKANALDSELCNGIIERFWAAENVRRCHRADGAGGFSSLASISSARSPAGPVICASSCP